MATIMVVDTTVVVGITEETDTATDPMETGVEAALVPTAVTVTAVTVVMVVTAVIMVVVAVAVAMAVTAVGVAVVVAVAVSVVAAVAVAVVVDSVTVVDVAVAVAVSVAAVVVVASRARRSLSKQVVANTVHQQRAPISPHIARCVWAPLAVGFAHTKCFRLRQGMKPW